MWKIRCKALQTDMMFWRHDGVIRDRDGYLVISDPDHPDYYWGNLLVFPHPPRSGDFERWSMAFEREFAAVAAVRHRTFAWDDPSGDLGESEAFSRAGFDVGTDVTLIAQQVVRPRHYDARLSVAPIETEREWQQVYEEQMLVMDEAFSAEERSAFVAQRYAKYRAMIAAGLGTWLGARIDGRIVGDLGLFIDGRVARYQNVVTHPGFRGRGVCRSLVHRAAVWARERVPDLESLVVVADPEERAGRIYQDVGFVPVERVSGACLPPERCAH